MTITFKAKLKTSYYTDNTIHKQGYQIPKITHNHCDMDYFRNHSRYGAYANSNLFLQMINNAVSKNIGKFININNIPENVTIDDTGFLSTITITL